MILTGDDFPQGNTCCNSECAGAIVSHLCTGTKVIDNTVPVPLPVGEGIGQPTSTTQRKLLSNISFQKGSSLQPSYTVFALKSTIALQSCDNVSAGL